MHQKHMADLCMLETVKELDSAFINQQTGMPKSVECIRVDGASDKGPSHEEVLDTAPHPEEESCNTDYYTEQWVIVLK